MKFKLNRWISNRLANLFAPYLKGENSGNAYVYVVGGDVLSQPDDMQALIKAKEVDPFVGIAISKISSAINSLPLKVYRKEIDDNKVSYEEDVNHPANEILDYPNPYNSINDIKTHITQSYILTGNAYLVIERNGSRINIHPKESDKMKIRIDKNGALAEYIYGEKQFYEKKYKPEEICHIRNYDCTNMHYGRSPLLSVENMILLNYYATQTNKAIFRNGPIPAGMFFTEFDLSEDQRKELIKSFEARHKGSENQGKIGVAPAFVKDFKVTQIDIKDMLYNEQTRLIREIIFAQLGLPPFVGGVMEYANYANALPQDRSFYQNTISPLSLIQEEALTRQILLRYYDKSGNYVYGYDLSGVPALQSNEKERASNYAILVRSGILTPNEARQMGYELPPLEGGDELSINRMLMGVPGEIPASQEAKSKSKKISSGKSDRISYWKRFDFRLGDEEAKFQRLMKRYFREQQSRVIEELNKYTGSGKLLAKLDIYQKADIPPDSDSIFNLKKENEILKEKTESVIRDGLRRSAESVYQDFSLDFVFNVRNERVLEAIEEFESALAKINDLNYESIRSILSEGYSNGLSLSEIEQNIRKEFDLWISYRPERIARTEMLGVLNRGSLLGYEQAEIEKLEWIATQDERTRDAHSEIDGSVINIGERFNVGGELMRHPGDPSASAGNIVNCRCTTAPVI